jgi:hypothetical protein
VPGFVSRSGFVCLAVALFACGSAPARRSSPAPTRAPAASPAPVATLPPPPPSGLWLPEQMPRQAEALKRLGLALDVKELSDPLSGVLPAIVNLGGCSASFVSDAGLIVTNHHCAMSALQHNSTPAKNRLEDGHLAARREDELSSGPAGRVYVTRAFRDVSEGAHAAIAGIDDDLERARAFERFEKATLAACEREQPGIRCEVKTFYDGLRVSIVERLELRDVRIVYAPPEAIGNYGGEVDNWRWPRHTGDFAFFRAYVGRDGKPADYHPDNVPYRPTRFLRVSTKPLAAGNLVIVAGFPGRTSTLSLSRELDEVVSDTYPKRLGMFEAFIAAIEAIAQEDPAIRIKGTGFIRRYNNFRTKHRGELEGIERFRLLEKKREDERALAAFIDADPRRKQRSGAAFAGIEQAFAARSAWREADRALTSEILAARLLYAASVIARVAEERQKPDAERALAYQERKLVDLRDQLAALDQQYHPRLDKALLVLALERQLATSAPERSSAFELLAGPHATPDTIRRAVDALYRTTRLGDRRHRLELFDRATPASLAKSRDPLVRAGVSLLPVLLDDEDRRKRFNGALLLHGQRYAEARLENAGGLVAPDANGTLRLSYGTVLGPPEGGAAFTTTAELVQKHTGTSPFDAPEALRKAVIERRFGTYASPTLGEVPVNFLSTAKSTNGNSGSATLDAEGKLVGLLFDSRFDSVASDFAELDITRSIYVDMRFVLFVLDAVTKADALLAELGVVPSTPR